MSGAPVSPPSGPVARQYLDEANRLLATLGPLAKGRFAEASLVMAEPPRSRDGWRVSDREALVHARRNLRRLTGGLDKVTPAKA